MNNEESNKLNDELWNLIEDLSESAFLIKHKENVELEEKEILKGVYECINEFYDKAEIILNDENYMVLSGEKKSNEVKT